MYDDEYSYRKAIALIHTLRKPSKLVIARLKFLGFEMLANPMTIPKHKGMVVGIENIIIFIYAKGLIIFAMAAPIREI